MVRTRLIAAALSGLAFLSACTRQEAIPPLLTPVSDEPTAAQPRLPTLKLWIGAAEMTAELARRTREIQTGMMFRTRMGDDEGMLFVFGLPHQAAFWMKNTHVPLSAAYVDPEGAILEIHDLEPHNTNSVVATSDRVQYVLETPQGWFQRHNIGPGTVIRTERGTLAETFFGGNRP